MGPLHGTRIVEVKGIGPGPYAGMLLADLGAEVIVVERSTEFQGVGIPSSFDVHSRGKRSIALNLKTPQGLEVLHRLIGTADALIEGFRPGVAERLGFGPEDCEAINPKLVYGRITGWGQTGPLSQAAGHDINYIALTGALAGIGPKDAPVPPLNIVGDYAGGSLFLVMGVLAGIIEARSSGKGQVVDTAITDGSANLMSLFYSMSRLGFWNAERESNLIDGGAYFYTVYETADAKHISLGPLEPQFYQVLVEKVGLDLEVFGGQAPPQDWPKLKGALAEVFRQKTRDEWCEILEGTDACFAPVLDYNEAIEHPHNRARGTYIDVDGHQQPAPAPRFSRTQSATPSSPPSEGQDTDRVLADLGYSDSDIESLRSEGALS